MGRTKRNLGSWNIIKI
uniref:Uncharacterized protein n=1 Tax=Rhizophora mucronata TaxID=61149 RepID=A0A2P2R1B0_RHIMU